MLTETEFYDQLAKFFDVMTDWQSRLAVELPFLETLFAQHHVRAILDSACGTGGHAIALAQRGYHVAASDISTAMIARASENAERAGVTIPFAVVRLQTLRGTFAEKFDAVLCLGNSFVHILTDGEALDSFGNIRECLRKDGVLILHNLNYDRRWRDKPRWFAVNAGTLDKRETLVWRFADYDEVARQIQFNIALFTKNENHAWSVQVQSTPQRPYHQSEMELLLRRAGFREITFYGNLQGAPFDVEQSPDLVVVAVM